MHSTHILTLPPPEGGGFSGDARPKGPRWRLRGLPGPTARGAASEEAAITEPCTQRRAHNGETALSPCLQAGACAPTEKVIALLLSGLEIVRDVLEFTAKLWSQQNERGDDDERHERDDEGVFHQALPAAASKD